MTAGLLWVLLALFALRVLGQAWVAFFDAAFLPPMAAWYSGLMPYEYLLPSQIFIIALMARICVDFTRRDGSLYRPRKLFATAWLCFGYLYLALMLARAVFLWDRPIPIVFHWVLAAFIITVGLSHRQRLAR
jgi:hypothetical protein